MMKRLALLIINEHSGQTLLEVILAVVIMSMVAIAFVKFSVVSLQTVAYYNHKHEALYLADQEALAILNNDYATIPNTYAPSQCHNQPVSVTKGSSVMTYTINVTQSGDYNNTNNPNPVDASFNMYEYTIEVTWQGSDHGSDKVDLNVYSANT